MKEKSRFHITRLLLCVMLVGGLVFTGCQKNESFSSETGAKPEAAKPAGSPQEFARLMGRWSAILSYVHSGNQFTVSRAEDVQVKQPDANTIAFSIKPMVSAEPVFDTKLSYDPTRKKFFLSVKTDGRETLEKTELAYDANAGFSGKGILRDIQEKTHPVEATITFTRTGGHEWTIKDLTQPGKSLEVFAFSFSKRLD